MIYAGNMEKQGLDR